MRSSLADAIPLLNKYKSEGLRLHFACSVGGMTFGMDGLLSEATDKSLTVRGNGCTAFVSWEDFKLSTIDYFEPREVPIEFRDQSHASYWQFTSSDEHFFMLAELK